MFRISNVIFYRNLVVLFCLLILTSAIYGFEVDTIHLLPAEIRASRLSQHRTGIKIETLDTNVLKIYQSASLADVIDKQSTFYVKSYGSGGLATLSVRGTSSSENAVLWNGINLNSPVLGDFDLSNIPVAFFDNIVLQYGGGSALYGSGIIGGSIRLENTPVFHDHIGVKVNATAGSFSNYGASGRFVYGNQHLETSTAFNYKGGKNDYPFFDGQEKRRLTNAAMQQYGFMEDFAVRTTGRSFLKTSVWYQYNEKQIPPTMVMSESLANSRSEDVRASLQWKYVGKITQVNAKGGYFYNDYRYSDGGFVNSQVNTNSGIMEIDVQNRITEGLSLNVGGNLSYFNAMQEVYGTNKEEYHLSFFALLRYDFRKIPLSINLNLRQQFVDWDVVPFTPYLGIESNFWSDMFVSASVGANYRTPTFNERYWTPGGNPDIKSEQSLNEEIQLGWKSDNYILKEVSATVYNSNLRDKILWVPVSGTIWSPENVESVWSRGVEGRVSVGGKVLNWRYGILTGYAYVASTNQETKLQLIYTPKHSGFVNLNVGWKYLELNYSQKVVSRSYTASDNSVWIDGYTTADLSLSGDVRFKSSLFRITGTVKNLFNTDYQTIKYFPMPGVNFEVSLSYNFR